MSASHIDAVARDVVRFFVQHPAAVDSLEGIAHWRLLKLRVRDVVEETDAALRLLVEQGLVDRIPGSGGASLFRLHPDKRDAARQFLGDRS